MTPEDRAMYRLPEDALGAIHFRAIERIYGDSVCGAATLAPLL